MENPSDDSVAMAGALGPLDINEDREKEDEMDIDERRKKACCCSDTQLALDSLLISSSSSSASHLLENDLSGNNRKKHNNHYSHSMKSVGIMEEEKSGENNKEEEERLETLEILVSPTESEALELERQLLYSHQTKKLMHRSGNLVVGCGGGVKGISASDTTVLTSSGGENNPPHPFFPADITGSNAVFMPMRPKASKSRTKGEEIMPKYLPQPPFKKITAAQICHRNEGYGLVGGGGAHGAGLGGGLGGANQPKHQQRLYVSTSPYCNPITNPLGVIEEVDEDGETETS